MRLTRRLRSGLALEWAPGTFVETAENVVFMARSLTQKHSDATPGATLMRRATPGPGIPAWAFETAENVVFMARSLNPSFPKPRLRREIGRASCWYRVCMDVKFTGVAV